MFCSIPFNNAFMNEFISLFSLCFLSCSISPFDYHNSTFKGLPPNTLELSNLLIACCASSTFSNRIYPYWYELYSTSYTICTDFLILIDIMLPASPKVFLSSSSVTSAGMNLINTLELKVLVRF